MLLDLVDTNNYAMYNIKLAQTISLEGAVYCNQLLSIQAKAIRKQKLVDKFVCVDRDYIKKQTTLDWAKQSELDQCLKRLGVLEISEKNKNWILVKVDALGALITNDDLELQVQLSEVAEGDLQKKRSKVQAKEAKQEVIKSKLMSAYTRCPIEMQVALGNWIDAVNQNPKVPPVNKLTLRKFYDDINAYTKGENLDLALWLINTSAAYG